MVDLRKHVANQFAKQTMSKASEMVGISSAETSVSKIDNNGPIQWHNYNYPPLLRLIHYSTDQLRQPYAGLARKMHICALLIVIVSLFNCKV
jgi:hypothetical protein